MRLGGGGRLATARAAPAVIPCSAASIQALTCHAPHAHNQCPCKTASCRRRVFQYYLPVFFWCEHQLEQHRAAAGAGSTPLVLGISAPQASSQRAGAGSPAPASPLCISRPALTVVRDVGCTPAGTYECMQRVSAPGCCPLPLPLRVDWLPAWMAVLLQGCGKTTLCEQLEALFAYTGARGWCGKRVYVPRALRLSACRRLAPARHDSLRPANPAPFDPYASAHPLCLRTQDQPQRQSQSMTSTSRGRGRKKVCVELWGREACGPKSGLARQQQQRRQAGRQAGRRVKRVGPRCCAWAAQKVQPRHLTQTEQNSLARCACCIPPA